MSSYFHDLARLMFFFVIGGPLFAEIVGYSWHRGTEHNGWLGNSIRYRHWVHHKIDYPIKHLRREDVVGYKNAGSWSWYVAVGLAVLLIFIALPLRDALPLAISGSLYGKYVLGALHQAFHTQNHWLSRFRWFRTIERRHDIHHWVVGNYGIAFFFMDRIFGTLRDEFPEGPEEMFPDYIPPRKANPPK